MSKAKPAKPERNQLLVSPNTSTETETVPFIKKGTVRMRVSARIRGKGFTCLSSRENPSRQERFFRPAPCPTRHIKNPMQGRRGIRQCAVSSSRAHRWQFTLAPRCVLSARKESPVCPRSRQRFLDEGRSAFRVALDFHATRNPARRNRKRAATGNRRRTRMARYRRGECCLCRFGNLQGHGIWNRSGEIHRDPRRVSGIETEKINGTPRKTGSSSTPQGQRGAFPP
jgi:hypothetical protein